MPMLRCMFFLVAPGEANPRAKAVTREDDISQTSYPTADSLIDKIIAVK